MCKFGHSTSLENIYIRKDGYTECRDCRREQVRKFLTSSPKGYTNNHTNFSGLRELAIGRDNGACVKCGMTRRSHRLIYGKDITVDHIDGRGTNLPKHLKNNSLDNLQTLCLRCHGKKDVKRRGIKQLKEN